MGKTLNGFLERCYFNIWLYFPEFALSLFVDFSKSDCIKTYHTLLENILSADHLLIRTIRDLQRPSNSEATIMGLRHDIDYDVTTTARLAKIEHAFGLQGSYYVLHTAPYYGHFKDGKYYRSERCLDILLEIQSMGHEIGLHNDTLYPLTKYGIPLEETLQSELFFLRSHGVQIYGTASHGSYHTYGASNYEIFAGMSIERREHFIDKNGKEHRIGYLNMKDFNLDYEANYILKSGIISAEEWNRISFPFKCPSEQSDFFIRGYDAQYGIFGKNLWLAQNIKKVKAMGTLLPISSLTTGEVIRQVKSHGPGDRIVLDSHPIYFGHSWRRIILKYLFDHLTSIVKKLFRFKGLE